MGAADFWNNNEKANRVIAELKSLRAVVEPVEKVRSRVDDAAMLWEMAEDEDDQPTRQEVDAQLDALSSEVDRLETLSLMSGKYDGRNCYLTIYSREGGTEAQDWTQMLM